MTTIKKGENALIDVTLYQSDGSALLLTNCSYIKFELIQNGTVLESWEKIAAVYDTGMSAVTTSKFRVEATKAISDALPYLAVSRRVTIEVADANFTIDTVQKDIDDSDLLIVE